MTIPNLLTLSRILLTPVFVWLVLENRLTSALLLFFVAGMTDAADGFIARFFDQKSRFGAHLDPLADKTLLVTSFLVLCHVGLIPAWLVIITVGRDLMIVSGICTLYCIGVKLEMQPLASSKATTFFQLFTVFVMLGSDLAPLPAWIYTALFFVTAGFSVYSGLRYFGIGRQLLLEHRIVKSGQ
ncbi:MAG: CDP-alcohol phosphatidyltransferase family protein [Syntrophobacter sp.]